MWGINKQDQTFSVLSQYSFQQSGSLQEREDEECIRRIYCPQPDCSTPLPRLTAYNALPHLVILAALQFICRIIAQILGG